MVCIWLLLNKITHLILAITHKLLTKLIIIWLIHWIDALWTNDCRACDEWLDWVLTLLHLRHAYWLLNTVYYVGWLLSHVHLTHLRNRNRHPYNLLLLLVRKPVHLRLHHTIHLILSELIYATSLLFFITLLSCLIVLGVELLALGLFELVESDQTHLTIVWVQQIPILLFVPGCIYLLILARSLLIILDLPKLLFHPVFLLLSLALFLIRLGCYFLSLLNVSFLILGVMVSFFSGVDSWFELIQLMKDFA